MTLVSPKSPWPYILLVLCVLVAAWLMPEKEEHAEIAMSELPQAAIQAQSFDPAEQTGQGAVVAVQPATVQKEEPEWDENPFFVTLKPNSKTGLSKKSSVDCYQIRAISHNRFVKKIGNISNTEINLIKKAIALILYIEPKHCE